jgi:predicted acyl esterase
MKVLRTFIVASCLIAATLAQQPNRTANPVADTPHAKSSEAMTASLPSAKYPAFPSETPEKFEPVTESFDYLKQDVMIPMRDGVKLHTIIIVPKGAKGAPILLTRTPYDAAKLTSHAQSAHLGPILNGYDNATEVIVEGGYIRVVQDIRGKHGSEGDYTKSHTRGPRYRYVRYH